jgi:hypothetical protein
MAKTIKIFLIIRRWNLQIGIEAIGDRVFRPEPPGVEMDRVIGIRASLTETR